MKSLLFWKRIFPIALLVFLGIGFLTQRVGAAEFISSPDSSTADVVLSTNETHRNVYTAGNSVVINSSITGDIVAAGKTITQVGSVEVDAMYAGMDITVSGPVNGDVRAAGKQITLTKPVQGDVLLAASSVSLGADANVGLDAVIAGEEVAVNAPISGSAKITGGKVYLNSEIKGAVQVKARELVIGPNARFSQAVRYTGPVPAQVDPQAQINGVDFTEQRRENNNPLNGIIYLLLSLGLLAVALYALTRNFARAALEYTKQYFLIAVLIGLFWMIILPIIAAIVFVFSPFLSLFIFALWLAAIILGWAYGMIFLGYLLIGLGTKNWSLRWLTVVVGVVVSVVLTMIPVIGWLISFLITAAGIGGVVVMLRRYMTQPPVNHDTQRTDNSIVPEPRHLA